ncbi:MAG: domain containing protein [Verrucomicrobiales bacterium]|nr:domain containing protein [Verrucomicrobiales bacterium]
MAVVRILVDGYSLLHSWPELAPGKARYSAAAREELVHQLMLYRDSVGTPITVVFDGAGPAPDASQVPSTPECEIIFSRSGQSADNIIERVAAMMKPYGEIIAVTNDRAERDTVVAMGGFIMGCDQFIRDIQLALGEMQNDIKRLNRREGSGFNDR